MTKAQRDVSVIVLLFSIYTALFLGYVPLSNTIQNEIIPVLPLWAIVSIGAYLLFQLGWGVFTFNDVPEAHKELLKEIEMAKADLKQKGITIR